MRTKSALILMLLVFSLSACYKDPAVDPNEHFFVPTSFSPNNDGVNDYFEVKADYVASYSIKIYSPDNILLFTSDDIKASWNGEHAGIAAPAGSYLWIIDYVNRSSKSIHRSGYVELVR